MIDFTQLKKDVQDYYKRLYEYRQTHKKPEPQPEYTIIGDTPEFKGCLVYVCGKDKQCAEIVLHRLINNPTEQEKKRFSNHTNFRIERVEPEKCWWNQGGLD